MVWSNKLETAQVLWVHAEGGVVAYCRLDRADLPQQSAFAAHVGSCQYNKAGSLVSQLNIIGHKGAPSGYPNPSCRVTQRLG